MSTSGNIYKKQQNKTKENYIMRQGEQHKPNEKKKIIKFISNMLRLSSQ